VGTLAREGGEIDYCGGSAGVSLDTRLDNIGFVRAHVLEAEEDSFLLSNVAE
jgi:hypothetical protein